MKSNKPRNEPTSVVMTLADGRVIEEMFLSRLQAESFLYLLPYQAFAQPDDARVVEAILSPLVTQDMALTTPKTGN